MNRKLVEHRKSLHGQLVNQVFSLGNEVTLEKLSLRAYHKMCGKSVGMCASGRRWAKYNLQLAGVSLPPSA